MSIVVSAWMDGILSYHLQTPWGDVVSMSNASIEPLNAYYHSHDPASLKIQMEACHMASLEDIYGSRASVERAMFSQCHAFCLRPYVMTAY